MVIDWGTMAAQVSFRVGIDFAQRSLEQRKRPSRELETSVQLLQALTSALQPEAPAHWKAAVTKHWEAFAAWSRYNLVTQVSHAPRAVHAPPMAHRSHPS